jgi:hypothetical protein
MIFGGYWAFLEPNSWEEVGGGKPTFPLFNQGHFEAKGTAFGEQFRAEMLRQSQVKASLRQGSC